MRHCTYLYPLEDATLLRHVLCENVVVVGSYETGNNWNLELFLKLDNIHATRVYKMAPLSRMKNVTIQ